MRIFTNYEGRQVRLTDERLRHILLHPEMAGVESMIEAALLEPEFVIQSLWDDQAFLYYRLLPRPHVGVEWMCVVVKRALENSFVLTA